MGEGHPAGAALGPDVRGARNPGREPRQVDAARRRGRHPGRSGDHDLPADPRLGHRRSGAGAVAPAVAAARLRGRAPPGALPRARRGRTRHRQGHRGGPQRGGRIPLAVAPIKLAATVVTIGVGGSVGKEGPAAQIGASLASGLASILRPGRRDRRKVVICAIGAGFATVFAPDRGGHLRPRGAGTGLADVRRALPLVRGRHRRLSRGEPARRANIHLRCPALPAPSRACSSTLCWPAWCSAWWRSSLLETPWAHHSRTACPYRAGSRRRGGRAAASGAGSPPTATSASMPTLEATLPGRGGAAGGVAARVQLHRGLARDRRQGRHRDPDLLRRRHRGGGALALITGT